jgi:hypothetical protein
LKYIKSGSWNIHVKCNHTTFANIGILNICSSSHPMSTFILNAFVYLQCKCNCKQTFMMVKILHIPYHKRKHANTRTHVLIHFYSPRLFSVLSFVCFSIFTWLHMFVWKFDEFYKKGLQLESPYRTLTCVLRTHVKILNIENIHLILKKYIYKMLNTQVHNIIYTFDSLNGAC